MNKLIYILLLCSMSLLGQDYPQEYFNQIQAAETKNRILLMDDSVDFVIDAIEQVPLVLTNGQIPTNHAKEQYSIVFEVPKRKGITFIIDSEGRYEHEDLIEATDNSLARIFTGETSWGNVNGHGIHVGGILASRKEGLLYEYARRGYFKIVPLKGLKDNGSGSYDKIMEALWYVDSLIDSLQAANNVVGVNMSLGSQGFYPPINTIIDRLRDRGVIITVSSGNTGQEPIGTPSNADGAIAVGSIDKDNNLSYFSSRGDGLYIVSYGQEINSTDINNTYTVKNGTSMSAPNQHGWYMHRAMMSDNDLQYIIDTAFVIDLGSEGYDIYYGHGVSNSTPDSIEIIVEEPKTYNLPISDKFDVVFGGNVLVTKKFYITEINVDLTSTLPSYDALESLMIPTRKFFHNRGFIVRNGDDFDEAVEICWFFYDMFMTRDDLDISINYIDAEIDGLPLRIYEPYNTLELGINRTYNKSNWFNRKRSTRRAKRVRRLETRLSKAQA